MCHGVYGSVRTKWCHEVKLVTFLHPLLFIFLYGSSFVCILGFLLRIRVSNELGAGRPQAARLAASTAVFLVATEGLL